MSRFFLVICIGRALSESTRGISAGLGEAFAPPNHVGGTCWRQICSDTSERLLKTDIIYVNVSPLRVREEQEGNAAGPGEGRGRKRSGRDVNGRRVESGDGVQCGESGLRRTAAALLLNELMQQVH